jgi:hypothetical protein
MAMHLRRVRIENVRSLRELEWTFEKGKSAGWHVVLGNNGSGKSSVLQAIAYCAIGLDWYGRVPQRWVRRGSESAKIETELFDGWNTSSEIGPEPPWAGYPLAQRHFEGNEIAEHLDAELWRAHEQRRRSYFSCGFGSLRRFGPRAYGDERADDESKTYARHRTLFKQEAVLTDALEWLQDLEFRAAVDARENSGEPGGSERLLNHIRSFINKTEFLPYGTQLGDVTPDAVEFLDGNGVKLAVEELSDGYRSVLGVTFELIRRLAEHYGADAIWSTDDPPKIQSAGVVLIDEIDAHLHPSWQRKVGYWFTDWFPNIQFIVTTHSPLVCQAAERGSILRLPDPGTDESPRVVQGLERERLLYGNILDAYATPSFGHVPTRSDSGQAKLERLAELNHKSLREDLSEEELDEREHLLRMMPTGRVRSLDAAE